MAEHTWPAPAKINLFLHVLGRLDDGYHQLQTLYQLLDWGDELVIEITDTPRLEMMAPTPGVAPEQDLCLRAARLLQTATGSDRGARLAVHKQIPMGAGLGGGSSNAATVLHALNHGWGTGLGTEELAELGLQLGADVPAFVHGLTAWAEGRGERLRPMPQGERWYVLAVPDVQVSTARVFNAPQLARNTSGIEASEYAWERCRNDCQEVVLQLYPELREWLAGLAEWGEPRMTGTGSCFYLRVGDRASAGELTRALKSRYNVRAVRGVDASPLLEKCAPAR